MPARNSSALSSPSATLLTNHMKLSWIALDVLKASGRKTRSHTRDQIRKLADSIRTFGFSVPILVDDDNKILAGHARLEAARAVGLDKVPVVVLSHLTTDQKRAFVIAENRLAELAGWDRDTLRIELQEISELDIDFELTVIGFDEPEIDAILYSGMEGEERGDLTPDVPGHPVSVIGDLWLLGDHRLYCGDATSVSSLAAVMNGEAARTVFTDSPYNVQIRGHVTKTGTHGEFVMASGEMSDAEFTAFLASIWGRIEEALVPGGLAYFCMDWRHMRHVLDAAAGGRSSSFSTSSSRIRNRAAWGASIAPGMS